ncbi:hypothetical protein [Crenobacter cavernae]|uniref:hypothetical protein n=1 Tax=Crenobacter cavernae TaxID=2290923 RepID=UPI0015F17DA0|nr:hypothetical protein [Crenobacter cavernae]
MERRLASYPCTGWPVGVDRIRAEKNKPCRAERWLKERFQKKKGCKVDKDGQTTTR